MSRITKAELVKDAKALKLSLSEEEIDLLFDEVNEYMDMRPDIDYTSIEPLRYVNPEVVNVFSDTEENLVVVEDLLKNVKDREGNYIKVPKVLK